MEHLDYKMLLDFNALVFSRFEGPVHSKDKRLSNVPSKAVYSGLNAMALRIESCVVRLRR